MGTLINQPASNLKPGFYKVISINYPMANAIYKTSITEHRGEDVQIELSILDNPNSSGPIGRNTRDLTGKIFHIIESGKKAEYKNFQTIDVDYVLWQVINKESYQALVDKKTTNESSFNLAILKGPKKWDYYDQQKKAGIQLPLDEQEDDSPERYYEIANNDEKPAVDDADKPDENDPADPTQSDNNDPKDA